MPFTLGDLAGLVERIAPAQLAEEWDNAGLQAGDPAAPAPRVLIGLEPEQSLIEEALERGARAIVTHHPLIFRPLRAVRADDRVGRIVLRLAREGLGLVVAHTNLDKSPAGPNAALADCLGLERRRWLKPHTESGGCKLVVFTPKGHEAAVIAALAEGGAGVIGKYTHCTFRAEGIGTYLPQEGARPYAGRPGRFEEAEEWRLEAVCPRERLPRVLELVLRAHPYEEPAYDVVPLDGAAPRYGLGLAGELSAVERLGDLRERLAARLAERLSPSARARFGPIRLAGDPRTAVRRVAICSGAGGSLVRDAARAGAECFVTGELDYHAAVEARALGLAALALGHFASEALAAAVLAEALRGEVRAQGVAPEPVFLPAEGESDPFLGLG